MMVTQDTGMSPETKAVHNTDRAALDELMRGFEAFKQENDRRLELIEKGRSGDVLVDEKLERINSFMDEAQTKMNDMLIKQGRPKLEAKISDEPMDANTRLHKKAFELYMRSGETSGLKALESKALSGGSGPDGGYLVTPATENEILRRMSQASPIRAIASVRQISTANFRKAYSTTGPGAGWVAETAAVPTTSSQQIVDLNFPAMELYAMPSATQTLLDDAAVNVEQWIASEVETVFAEQEGAAFVNGDGVTRPLGFQTPTKVAQSAWVWGKLGYVATGTAGAFATAAPSDALFDLIYALKAGYRQNARFVMNRKTQSVIRKMKTTTGEYLWQPPMIAGGQASLLNFPLVEAEDMPDIAAGSTAIAFGNFERGYLIVDRIGVRVLRDPYSAKPYILYYTTKRVGGGVQDFDAIKFLKFDVS
jgi:HK97 family phage major capsid protein